jgi:hypothetical protein
MRAGSASQSTDSAPSQQTSGGWPIGVGFTPNAPCGPVPGPRIGGKRGSSPGVGMSCMSSPALVARRSRGGPPGRGMSQRGGRSGVIGHARIIVRLDLYGMRGRRLDRRGVARGGRADPGHSAHEHRRDGGGDTFTMHIIPTFSSGPNGVLTGANTTFPKHRCQYMTT